MTSPAAQGSQQTLSDPSSISYLQFPGGQRLKDLWQRGTTFLGVEKALMGGAMSWISDRSLVAAISNAGGFGVIACGAMPADQLEIEIKATQALTSSPFGVNLITLHPDLEALIDVCTATQVTHVVLAGGIPPKGALEKLKKGGGKTLCFAPTLSLAKRLVRGGADALIIEGSEAGGHIGPVSTSVLAQEILPEMSDVPVFVAGGIGRGHAIATYLEMGASGCQLGTRFVCAKECRAHPNFKKAFMRASARDAVVSVQLDDRFPVIPVRALANQGMKAFLEAQRRLIAEVDAGQRDLKSAQLDIEHFWAGALRKAVIDGDIETGSLMAGQSVGMVKREESLQEIMDHLVQETCLKLSSA